MMKKLIAAVCLAFAFSASASPLESGISFAQFCKPGIERDGSPEQLLCMGYFIGTMKGYNTGVMSAIVDPSNEHPTNKELAELGKAIVSGRVDGYCTPQDINDGNKLRIAIATIIATESFHEMPPHNALMRALSKSMPCESS